MQHESFVQKATTGAFNTTRNLRKANYNPFWGGGGGGLHGITSDV
jgi:hypothetical protein